MNINSKGFTLIELLIVIGIISVLAVAVVVVINPAELLAQARDSTRLSDLASINSAIGLYLVDVSSPSFGATSTCTAVGCADATPGDGWGDLSGFTVSATTDTDGNGWVGIDLQSMSTGAPLPRYPVDPSNADNGTLFYAYNASSTALTFELNARMESDKFGPGGGDDVSDDDGGNNTSIYEVGTNLELI